MTRDQAKELVVLVGKVAPGTKWTSEQGGLFADKILGYDYATVRAVVLEVAAISRFPRQLMGDVLARIRAVPGKYVGRHKAAMEPEPERIHEGPTHDGFRAAAAFHVSRNTDWFRERSPWMQAHMQRCAAGRGPELPLGASQADVEEREQERTRATKARGAA